MTATLTRPAGQDRFDDQDHDRDDDQDRDQDRDRDRARIRTACPGAPQRALDLQRRLITRLVG
ncbi:hypothetical protein LWC33_04260 [Pseudonocardia sp. RS11V-5]|uniref:hypothetical protein n=1 Tax=Pseudonocardia terrae TaxID=2905831 RepID=UPI001E3C260D|nr:hypothetical protein [Pseudonocardia terrae]MCE3550667.1 hypothetical protein [Pseudonocardia terrae]